MQDTESKKKKNRAKPALSRDRILRAACKLADQKGAEGLSMRHLATKLKVEAMSLYYHFKNKDEILDGMVDQVFQEIAWPHADTPSDWQSAMRDRAARIRLILKQHPWALNLMENRKNPGLATLDHHEAVLACLRRSGFSIELTAHAYAIIDSFIYGFALQEQNLPFDTEDEITDDMQAIFASMPAERFPTFIEMSREHYFQPGYRFADEFDFGFDILLAGLGRRLSDEI